MGRQAGLSRAHVEALHDSLAVHTSEREREVKSKAVPLSASAVPSSPAGTESVLAERGHRLRGRPCRCLLHRDTKSVSGG